MVTGGGTGSARPRQQEGVQARLWGVDLWNFKSIADAQLRALDDFTCVVGPNGCGKSCLVGSKRWETIRLVHGAN
jgi:recombinational DNA repair ATPase RecF